MHIHATKADMECKFWIIEDEYEIKEEFTFNMSPAAKKEIKRIIYQNLDTIIESWNTYFKITKDDSNT